MLQLPDEIREKYPWPERDVDAEVFFDRLDDVTGRLLEVGCNDSPVVNMLAETGWFEGVDGIDLRPYGATGFGELKYPGKNFTFLQGNWLEVGQKLAAEQYDVVISLSAIEHFGLGTYNETWTDEQADVKAMELIYKVLKPGGKAYITVPFGKSYVVWGTDWRVYDSEALAKRIVGKFYVVWSEHFVSFDMPNPDKEGETLYKQGDRIQWTEAEKAPIYPPHVNVFLVLQKDGAPSEKGLVTEAVGV